MIVGDDRADMDSRENIDFFVDRFYERVLADELRETVRRKAARHAKDRDRAVEQRHRRL